MKIEVKQLDGEGLDTLSVIKWSDRVQITWSPF
jgi:hypothetical protein